MPVKRFRQRELDTGTVLYIFKGQEERKMNKEESNVKRGLSEIWNTCHTQVGSH